MLNVNPIIGMKNGEVVPFARERSRARAIDNLFNFAMGYSRIEGLAVEYATTPDEAERIAERLSAKFPKERIYRSKPSPVIGAHTGPGFLLVAILGDIDTAVNITYDKFARWQTTALRRVWMG